jgi:predicted nucleic acid-binding protein
MKEYLVDRGLDTTFLVQADVEQHPGHLAARIKRDEMLDAGDRLVLVPQVLAEFVHVVTDPRRFASPLSMPQALERAELWWDAQEVKHLFPTTEAFRLMLDWLRQHHLGRKRILDTQLAATLFSQGITSIVSSNARDYRVFGCFEVVEP